MAKINVNYIVYTDKNHKKQVLSLIFFFNLILIVKKKSWQFPTKVKF